MENYRHHDGLRAALRLAPASSISGGAAEGQGLSDEERRRLAAAYAALQQQYPRSVAVRRLPLDFLQARWPGGRVPLHVQPWHSLCMHARMRGGREAG